MIITQQTPSPFHHLLILQSRVRNHPSSISFREHWSNFSNSLCLHLKSLTSQIFIWPSLQSTALKKVHILCIAVIQSSSPFRNFLFLPTPFRRCTFSSQAPMKAENPPACNIRSFRQIPLPHLLSTQQTAPNPGISSGYSLGRARN